ncbi:hypothetical protein PINS_up006257 [Pythium insidiosum]|nr:hypothetical protein PINS_up006257 [Pythium insidiosum]
MSGPSKSGYRVKQLSAASGSLDATIARAAFDKSTARLAPGLAAIITVTFCFSRRGPISGTLEIETEGVGTCVLAVDGFVR